MLRKIMVWMFEIVCLFLINFGFFKTMMVKVDDQIVTYATLDIESNIPIIKDFEYRRIDSNIYRFASNIDHFLLLTNRAKEIHSTDPKACFYGLFIEEYRHESGDPTCE